MVKPCGNRADAVFTEFSFGAECIHHGLRNSAVSSRLTAKVSYPVGNLSCNQDVPSDLVHAPQLEPAAAICMTEGAPVPRAVPRYPDQQAFRLTGRSYRAFFHGKYSLSAQWCFAVFFALSSVTAVVKTPAAGRTAEASVARR